jgi:hypothetical protein
MNIDNIPGLKKIIIGLIQDGMFTECSLNVH